MPIISCSNYTQMCQITADILATQILTQPNSVLGLATGSTPIGVYENLVKRHQEQGLDFSHITTVNLDEYKGLAGTHPQSYRYFMEHHLFSHVNISKEAIYLPHGICADDVAECKSYEEILKKNPVHVQLLGIGHNGHIGFNEPSESFTKSTHCVQLTPSTIAANRRFFESESQVPQYAYTMGIGSIMRAKTIILVASGKEKAAILAQALQGEITPKVPASILQLHPHLVVVADKDAAALLQ